MFMLFIPDSCELFAALYSYIQTTKSKKNKMETLHNEDTILGITSYPETVSEIKSVINPQSLLWALIAIVLFVIYDKQPDKDTPLGMVQIALVLICAILALVKLFSGNKKLVYTPTGSVITQEQYYYNVDRESDILRYLKEGNIGRIMKMRTDDAGGILIETLESKDKAFVAIRMSRYTLGGYEPRTEWMVMKETL